MSITKNNVITKNYSGKFGEQVVFRNRYGKSIMAAPPKRSSTEPTEGQLNARKKFLLASRYAKNILQDPDKLAAYTAKAYDGRSPYVVALTDYLKPPFVNQIITIGYTGNPGDKISVEAGDDFALTQVMVKIIDPSGTDLIEQGVCTFIQATGLYEYTATAAAGALPGVTVTAIATDTPGHTTTLSITL